MRTLDLAPLWRSTIGFDRRKRLRWKTGDELRRIVDTECNGPHCRDATEILQLMKADIPILNNVRTHLVGRGEHV
jgi:hypothetical protein